MRQRRQSSEQTDGHQDSECDIYESDSDAESQEGRELRESGDGQEEEKPQKKLDDDEDRRNPQYIPKRGTFYEHDDRTTDEVTDNNTETQTNVKENKEKKVWKDKGDRWDHDRYNDKEQAPKKSEELIATYDYDIRNKEGPLRVKRRRNSRGPNKYTQNWEDEDAYGKTGNTVGRGNNRRFQKNIEHFPALGSKQNVSIKVEEPVISSAWYSSKNKTQSKVQNFPPLQSQQDNTKSKPNNVSNTSVNENKTPDGSSKKDNKHTVQSQNANGNVGSGDGDAEKLSSVKTLPKENNKRNTQESVSLNVTCRFFKQDVCKFGNQCHFRHNTNLDTNATQINMVENASSGHNNASSLKNKQDDKCTIEEWIKAPEFIHTVVPPVAGSSFPTDEISGTSTSTSKPISYAEAVSPSRQASSPGLEAPCPYAEATGICKKLNCTYLHGNIYELRNRASITNILKRIEIIELESKKKDEKLEKIENKVDHLSLKLDMINLGHMALHLRFHIISNILDKRTQKYRYLYELEELYSSGNMYENEMAKWEKFKNNLKEEDINIKQLDVDFRIVLNARNRYAHPNLNYD